MLKLTTLVGIAGWVLMTASAPLYATGTPIDVSLGDVSINKVPFLIAADRGIYAKNGLDVHQFITPGAAAVAARSGVVVPPEYVKSGMSPPIMVGGGSPMIVDTVNKPGAIAHVIVATNEAIVRDHVLANSSIKSLQDLRGKRVGYTNYGTVTHYDTLSLIEKMGWDPKKDVTLVPQSATLDALKEDKVDAVLGSAMIVALAEENHFKDVGDLTRFNMPLAGSGIMVRKDWLDANRDTVARFVKSSVEAVALMKTDRKVFDAALVKWFNIKDRETQDRMFAAVEHLPVKPYPSVAGIKGAMAIYDNAAMRAHKSEEFYDASFVAALDKSGFLDHPLK